MKGEKKNVEKRRGLAPCLSPLSCSSAEQRVACARTRATERDDQRLIELSTHERVSRCALRVFIRVSSTQR